MAGRKHPAISRESHSAEILRRRVALSRKSDRVLACAAAKPQTFDRAPRSGGDAYGY
jgi:hypothetical protein